MPGKCDEISFQHEGLTKSKLNRNIAEIDLMIGWENKKIVISHAMQ
jgi:hypothetical protein